MDNKLAPWVMGLIIVLVFILDQVTKYITKVSMYLGQSFSVWGDFFRITYVENPGMAFGMRIENNALFLGLSIFAMALVLYYLYRLRNDGWLIQSALSLITAGALGNIYDRFIHGRVIDFLDFEFFDISIPAFQFLFIHFSGYSMTRWPVFNVADSAVTIGMLFIFTHLILYGDPLKTKSVSPEPQNDTQRNQRY